jgi:predicted dehydrogenase
VAGSVDQPSVRLENLHALLKYSRGVAQRRPVAFLDVRQQGEGIADVGTHLVDIAQWTLFPGRSISYRDDVRLLRATHSALTLSLEQVTRLTGESAWPAYLKDRVSDDKLAYFSNGSCVYTVKGVHVSMKVNWQFEGAPGEGDSYFASYQGTRALVELRAGPKEHFVPQIYVTPVAEIDIKRAVDALQTAYPGLSFETDGRSFHLILPKAAAGDGLPAMFQQFLGYIRDWNAFPEFENDNLLAKYFITTKAVALANGR